MPFIGSIIVKGITQALGPEEKMIIDGQQRLTSLTLLLLFLRSKMNEIGQNYSTVDGMIYSEAFGKRSFNINVDEREAVLNAIYNNVDYKYDGKNESVKNIMNRYSDINEIFPIEIIENSLMNFIDWIIEKIFFIEIVATEEQDAHKVFVSMNDRGLSLTPTEMLKGYLLSEIVNDENREKYNDMWKEQVVLLKEIDKSEDETFIKHWLRARYAETIRETKANAIPMDFDNIGSGFHKWVRENRNLMKLHTSENFEKLIDEFIFYSKLYIRIKNYESNLDKDFKYIFYNAQLGFTFQMQLLFAPINLSDTEEIINKKLDLVSKYIDMYIKGYKRAKECAGDNFTVLLGCEVRFFFTIDDFLIYGIDENFLKNCGNLMVKYLRRLYKLCDKNELILIAAHPFRELRFRHKPSLLHGCEVFNGKDAEKKANFKAEKWAEKHGFDILTSGGDFHDKNDTIPGGIITDVPIYTNDDLLRILRSGNYRLIK